MKMSKGFTLIELLVVLFVIALFGVLLSTCFGGCADEKNICISDGKCYTFQPYGLFSSDKENKEIEYEVSVGNVVLSAIFVETIFVPIILIGWYLYEPVDLINHEKPIGTTK